MPPQDAPVSRCELCNKTLKLSKNMFRHMREVHPNDPVGFKCEVCGNTFKARNYLLRHVRNIHPQTPSSFNCIVCVKSFKCKENFNRHLRTVHPSGTSPDSKCEICDKMYKSRHHLVRHMKKIHPNQGTVTKYEYTDKSFDTKEFITYPHPNDQNTLIIKQSPARSGEEKPLEHLYEKPILRPKDESLILPVSTQNFNAHLPVDIAVPQEIKCKLCEKIFASKLHFYHHMHHTSCGFSSTNEIDSLWSYFI